MNGIAGLLTAMALLLGLYGFLGWAIGFAIAATVCWVLVIWNEFH